VVAPAPDSPAAKAGIKPQDLVLAIDGKSTGDMSLYEAAERLQGAVDSEVTLTVQSSATGSQRDVSMWRCAPHTANCANKQHLVRSMSALGHKPKVCSQLAQASLVGSAQSAPVVMPSAHKCDMA
jgi:C-terminal processing protease CtpA/Prc